MTLNLNLCDVHDFSLLLGNTPLTFRLYERRDSDTTNPFDAYNLKCVARGNAPPPLKLDMSQPVVIRDRESVAELDEVSEDSCDELC